MRSLELSLVIIRMTLRLILGQQNVITSSDWENTMAICQECMRLNGRLPSQSSRRSQYYGYGDRMLRNEEIVPTRSRSRYYERWPSYPYQRSSNVDGWRPDAQSIIGTIFDWFRSGDGRNVASEVWSIPRDIGNYRHAYEPPRSPWVPGYGYHHPVRSTKNRPMKSISSKHALRSNDGSMDMKRGSVDSQRKPGRRADASAETRNESKSKPIDAKVTTDRAKNEPIGKENVPIGDKNSSDDDTRGKIGNVTSKIGNTTPKIGTTTSKIGNLTSKNEQTAPIVGERSSKSGKVESKKKETAKSRSKKTKNRHATRDRVNVNINGAAYPEIKDTQTLEEKLAKLRKLEELFGAIGMMSATLEPKIGVSSITSGASKTSNSSVSVEAKTTSTSQKPLNPRRSSRPNGSRSARRNGGSRSSAQNGEALEQNVVSLKSGGKRARENYLRKRKLGELRTKMRRVIVMPPERVRMSRNNSVIGSEVPTAVPILEPILPKKNATRALKRAKKERLGKPSNDTKNESVTNTDTDQTGGWTVRSAFSSIVKNLFTSSDAEKTEESTSRKNATSSRKSSQRGSVAKKTN